MLKLVLLLDKNYQVDSMKKVAIITTGVLPIPSVRGGAAETLIDLFVESNKTDPSFDVTVFSIDDKRINHSNIETVSTHYKLIKQNIFLSFLDKATYFFVKNVLKKKNTTTFKNLLNRFFYYVKVRKYLAKIDFDLIVLENHCAEYLCLKPKKIYNKYYKKVIYHSHNEPAHYKPFIKIMPVTKAIYCVSSALADLWKQHMGKFQFMENVEFKVIKNGVRCDVFHPIDDKSTINEFKRRIKLPLDKKIVLFAGRMTAQKGVFELINAIKILDDSYHLLIVGDFFYDSKSKSVENLELKKQLISIEGRYTFTGFIPYSQMALAYNSSDVVVLPSIGFDAAPLTLIESICCCKPTISTRIGGIPEYSSNCGVVLLEVSDSLRNDIAKAIIDLENNSTYFKLVSMSERKRKEYDSKAFCCRYKKMLFESISEGE